MSQIKTPQDVATERFKAISPLLDSNLDSSLFCAKKTESAKRYQVSYRTIGRFDLAQRQQYIQAHLKYSGCEQEIFTDEAMKAIYDYSAGSARAINKVCMHSLLSAAQRGKKLIDDHLVHLVIETELP